MDLLECGHRRPAEYQVAGSAQSNLPDPVQQALCRPLQLPAAGYRHSDLASSSADFAGVCGDRLKPESGCPGSGRYLETAALCYSDRDADHRPGLPLQLLWYGLYTGPGDLQSGGDLPLLRGLPGMDWRFPEWQRHLQQCAVWEPASGSSETAQSQPGIDGCYELHRWSDEQNDLATECYDRGLDQFTGWQGRPGGGASL